MIGTVRIYLIAAAVAAVVSGLLWYRHALINKGRAECQESVQRAIEQQQAIANEDAAVYEAQRAKTRIEYRTRIERIREAVPERPDCTIPPAAVKQLNDAIRGGK